MSANRWETNFVRATAYELYVKPIVSALGVLLVASLIIWAGRRLGLLKPDGRDVFQGCMLACIFYYVFFLNAKIDMLKRTSDRNARFRPTTKLWIEEE